MKAWRLVALTVLVTICSTTDLSAQQVSLSIDQIVPNERIVGYVRGLRPGEHAKYKVIVYVHTDQWYIHPYAGQDEGLSWATVKENGAWQLQTVQRQFKADRIAALLVERSFTEPNKLERVEGIPNKAIVIKGLLGTPDHGKL